MGAEPWAEAGSAVSSDPSAPAHAARLKKLTCTGTRRYAYRLQPSQRPAGYRPGVFSWRVANLPKPGLASVAEGIRTGPTPCGFATESSQRGDHIATNRRPSAPSP